MRYVLFCKCWNRLLLYFWNRLFCFVGCRRNQRLDQGLVVEQGVGFGRGGGGEEEDGGSVLS